MSSSIRLDHDSPPAMLEPEPASQHGQRPEDVSQASPRSQTSLFKTWLVRLKFAWWKIVLPLAVFALTLWLALVFFVSCRFITPYNDFGKFFYATVQFLNGESMYAWSPVTPVKIEGYYTLDCEPVEIDLLNMNPPHFHALLLPLTGFPVQQAVGIWILVSLGFLVVAVKLTNRELGLVWSPNMVSVALFIVMASRATYEVLVNGQVTWFFLLPFTLMWIDARRDRWVRAGIWLGVLAAIKPFMLILVPYLIVERRWRSLAAAVGSALAVFAGGVLLFGMQNYVDWLSCLGKSDSWAWLPSNASLWGAIFARTLNSNPEFIPFRDIPLSHLKPIWFAVVALMGLLSLFVTKFDRSPERLDRAFALFMVASILFSPLGWVYYFWLAYPPLLGVMKVWIEEAHEYQALSWWSRHWQFTLLALAIPAAILPLPLCTKGQPSAVATLFLGNVYFWAAFVAWCVLLMDGIRKVRMPSVFSI